MDELPSSGRRTKDDAPVVLVVDDTEDNRDLFATVLAAEGYVVRTAGDGVAALAIADRSPPDVVVVDLAMPEMDGCEAIRRLREIAEGRAIYFIVVSALGDRRMRDAAFAAGAHAYLCKPCPPSDLLEAVRAGMDVVRARENDAS